MTESDEAAQVTPLNQHKTTVATILNLPDGIYSVIVRGKDTDYADIDDALGAITDLFEPEKQ